MIITQIKRLADCNVSDLPALYLQFDRDLRELKTAFRELLLKAPLSETLPIATIREIFACTTPEKQLTQWPTGFEGDLKKAYINLHGLIEGIKTLEARHDLARS